MKEHFSDARRIFAPRSLRGVGAWTIAHTKIHFSCALDNAVTCCALEHAHARALLGHRRRGGPGLQDGLFSLRIIALRALSCFNLAWIIDDGARATCHKSSSSQIAQLVLDVITSPTRSTRSRGCRRQCNGHDVRRELRVFLLGSVRSIYCAAPVQRERATKAALDSADRA